MAAGHAMTTAGASEPASVQVVPPDLVPAATPAGLGGDRGGRPLVRVRGVAQLLSVVPYLLGYRPAARDLVVIGTVASEDRARMTVRLDPAGRPDAVIAEAQARWAVAVLAVQGCTSVTMAGFGPDELIAPYAAAIGAAATAAGLGTGVLVRAEAGRYWSYSCADPECCPPAGTAYDPEGGPVAAAFEAAGATLLPSRDALAATIAPAAGADAKAIDAALRRAIRRAAVLARRQDDPARRPSPAPAP